MGSNFVSGEKKKRKYSDWSKARTRDRGNEVKQIQKLKNQGAQTRTGCESLSLEIKLQTCQLAIILSLSLSHTRSESSVQCNDSLTSGMQPGMTDPTTCEIDLAN